MQVLAHTHLPTTLITLFLCSRVAHCRMARHSRRKCALALVPRSAQHRRRHRPRRRLGQIGAQFPRLVVALNSPRRFILRAFVHLRNYRPPKRDYSRQPATSSTSSFHGFFHSVPRGFVVLLSFSLPFLVVLVYYFCAH